MPPLQLTGFGEPAEVVKLVSQSAPVTRAPRAEIDAAYREIVALVTNGELTADIDSTFRLERYADALSRAEHYQRRGKVLFVFGD